MPTNIITGFLGVGKTTTILHLLRNKPTEERWAVLVNEFGEIGIDGTLIDRQAAKQKSISIREVAGGCMCCSAGLPMQVALTQLLREARPDRLLIEPTGLGHPKEVVEVLQRDSFRSVLELHQVLTLVDARKIVDPLYASNDTFKQQLEISDIVVANKMDLYAVGDEDSLRHYLREIGSTSKLINAKFGKVSPLILDGQSHAKAREFGLLSKVTDLEIPLDLEPMPEQGFIKASNSGEGFHSVGWRFAGSRIFDRNKLFTLLSGIDATRIKGVFLTNEGCYGYNATPDSLTEVPLSECDESRVEIIALSVSDHWENEIFNCIR